MVILYKIENTLLFVGIDKFENDDLIKYSQRYMKELNSSVYWFHVDSFSSPHAYLRLNENETNIPPKMIELCSQIVRNGSIEGSKRPSVDIIYTECTNLIKSKSMDIGTVSFLPNSKIFYNKAVKTNNQLLKILEKSKFQQSIQEMEKELNDLIFLKKKNKKNSNNLKLEEKIEMKKETFIDSFLNIPKADIITENSDDFM